jgi:hypothetical protein
VITERQDPASGRNEVGLVLPLKKKHRFLAAALQSSRVEAEANRLVFPQILPPVGADDLVICDD